MNAGPAARRTTQPPALTAWRHLVPLKVIVSHGRGAVPYQRGRFHPGAFRQGTTYREILRDLYYAPCIRRTPSSC